MAACRAKGVPVFYARADHRADGMDYALTVADTDNKHVPWGPEHPVTWKPPHGAGDPGFQVISEIAPQPGDYDIPKHRWSAFHGTHLELSLRSRGIDTVLLIGGSTHVGIASTAYAARDMDFQVVVVSDCLTGLEEQRLFFAEKVFPRMVNVRRLSDVVAGLGADIATASA